MSAARNARRLAATLLAALATLPAFAGAERERERVLELGVVAGALLPDRELTGTRDPGPEPTLGVRVARGFTPRWSGFAELQAASFETKTFAGDVDLLSARVGAEWIVVPGRRAEPFVSMAWGHLLGSFDAATDYDSGFLSLGLGQHVWIGARSRLRWEVRADRALAPDGLRGEDLTLPQATVGVVFRLGGGSPDADGDGVAGHRDRCADTPAGARVDDLGCPYDGDADGVPDGLDACPATPAGGVVGPQGCPLDSDGDGVGDPDDACPQTPAAAPVDERGCPLDGDGDGVIDGVDRCPHTLRGILVDEHGCFLDADEDGVYDGLDMDRCPGTPKGVPVDRFGCPIEKAKPQDD